MNIEMDVLDDIENPLDCVEDVLAAHNWVFSRMTDDELVVEVSGKACDYRLFFIWQEDRNALQFCCQFDTPIGKNNLPAAREAILKINEALWMGHFDIPEDTGIPSFRHTCLLRGMAGIYGPEHIEDLVDLSLAQCERYHTVFHLLSNSEAFGGSPLSLALMDASGEA